MISTNEFGLFDPLQSKADVLPDAPGNYVVVLRHESQLPQNAKISANPQLSTFHYNEEEYKVIYVGESSTSLRRRDYHEDFKGSAGKSTLRKSLGCLMGFQQIPRDKNINGKTKFSEDNEETLSEWMETNLLLFFYANDEYAALKKELIKAYNPPLNLQGRNLYKINSEFRKELSLLRKQTSANTTRKNKSDSDCTTQEVPDYCCKVCGNHIKIVSSMKQHRKVKDIRCPSCGNVFRNPHYNGAFRDFMIKLLISVVIIFIGCLIFQPVDDTSEYIGDKQELTYSRAKRGVKKFLKQNYLKDPDSYESIEWGVFGIYS